jgi:hypothetical protein
MARACDLLMSLVVAAAMLTAVAPGLARADMMTACAPDIASFCSDVSRGRGRISACLMSREPSLSAACKPEVQAVAQSGANNRLVPAGVRNLMSGSGTAPAVPAACSADAGTFCSGVGGGSGNVLACLYARSNKVSSACSSAVSAALK